jgi:hypothetical protein
MSEKEKKDSRRTFLKAAGAIGAGSIIATLAPLVNASAKSGSKTIPPVTVPTRPFGKTGVDVSILSLGGVLGMSDLLIFRQAMKEKMRRQSANTLPNSPTIEKKCF